MEVPLNKIKNIVVGHINELVGNNKSISEQRLEICLKCPMLLKTPIGLLCNPNLYINKNNEISNVNKDGFVRGCSCRVHAKTSVSNEHCIVNKW